MADCKFSLQHDNSKPVIHIKVSLSSAIDRRVTWENNIHWTLFTRHLSKECLVTLSGPCPTVGLQLSIKFKYVCYRRQFFGVANHQFRPWPSEPLTASFYDLFRRCYLRKRYSSWKRCSSQYVVSHCKWMPLTPNWFSNSFVLTVLVSFAANIYWILVSSKLKQTIE